MHHIDSRGDPAFGERRSVLGGGSITEICLPTLHGAPGLNGSDMVCKPMPSLIQHRSRREIVSRKSPRRTMDPPGCAPSRRQAIGVHYLGHEGLYLEGCCSGGVVIVSNRLLTRHSWRLEGVSSSLLGPVDPSFRALSGRLKFTVRRHKFNKDSFSWQVGTDEEGAPLVAPKEVLKPEGMWQPGVALGAPAADVPQGV